MPFYEYECQSCKFYTEIMQKITDAPLRKCPSCGKNAMKKLISAPVFRLKGEGWYETDFKSDKEDKRNLAIEKEPEKEAAKEPEAKTAEPAAADTSKEAKPAAAAKPAKAPAKPVAAGKRRTAAASRRPVRAKPKPKARARRKARR